MTVENANFPGELVDTQPPGGDPKKEGDNHIRLLKHVFKTTFPGLVRAILFGGWEGKQLGAVIKAVDYDQLDTDDGKAIFFDCAATRLYRLIAVASAPAGMLVFVDRDKINTTTVLTIDPAGSELINEELTLDLHAGESCILYKLDTKWRAFITSSTVIKYVLQKYVSTVAGELLHLETTSDTAAVGPTILLDRIYSAPAPNQLGGGFLFRMLNASLALKNAALDYVQSVVVTAGTEEFRRVFQTMSAGVSTIRMYLGKGLYMGGALVDPGQGKINATAYQINGVQVGVIELQSFYDQRIGPVAGIATIIPQDDTPPLIGEGTQLFSQAVTPFSAASRIVFEGVIQWSGAAAGNELVVALFEGSTLLAVFLDEYVSNGMGILPFKFEVLSASVAPRTYSLRYGPGTAITIELNITAANDDYGDKVVTCWTIKEKLAV